MTERSTGRLPCAGVRIVEIGESVSAAVAGMVLADCGADVVVVEPPAGSRLDAAPASAMWSRGKRRERLDLTTDGGQARLGELAADCDVMLTALEPHTADRLGVDGASMCARYPRLVHCEITGFGRAHPLSGLPGLEGVVAAAAGRAYELGVLFDGTRPAFPMVPVGTHGAAMLALQGSLAALAERERSGRGQQIETSLLRALSIFDLSGWAPGAERGLRPFDAPMLFYTVARTRDGVWLQFSQNGPRLFQAFLRALELEHVLDTEEFRGAPNLNDLEAARALRSLLLARVRERTWDEWQRVFTEDPDVSAEPFAWPGDALRHPQLVHTGDSVAVDHPPFGPTRQLGPLISLTSRPADGCHTAEQPRGPLLRGATVLELSTWIATPMATALLAELGARVIKIETLDGDPMRRYGPAGLKCVQGKESIALDLKTDAGREIVHQLAAHADAFVHNYRPGVPERLGIDDATLRSHNPQLVYVYAASYGSTGPMAARPAFHVTAGAVCGGALAQSGGEGAPGPEVELSDDELAWWSQRLTRCNEANPDFNAALVVAAAVAMALYARATTGDGQTIETRMMAANAYALSEHFIDYRGRPARRFPDAGVHGLHALYRLYEAREGWVFVAAPGDCEFAQLCDALGRPSLAQDARFTSATARARHDDELAVELGNVFARRDAAEWERELAPKGVAVVRSYPGSHAAYVFDAPWSRALGLVEEASSTGMGPYPRYGRVVRSPGDLGPLGAADVSGAQTRRILAELGYRDDEIEQLHADAIVASPS